jgi:Domain of unknown function DUF222./HNH endonuclease.
VAESFSDIVDRLVDTDISEMPDAAVRAEFVELSRAIDRLEHRRARLLAVIHRRGIPNGDGAASTPMWAQWQTGQRAGEARAALDAGLACETLPLTAKAWAQGEISASAGRTICSGRPEGHEAAYGNVEDTLVDFAAAGNWRALRAAIAYCRRCADALDDREPADRNGLHHSKAGDRWTLSADLDDLGGTTLDVAIRAATDRPRDDDARSASKRRADALVRIARFFLDHADLPVEGGEAPHVSIIVDWNTIRDAQPSTSGGGPSLSPTQVAELLCDSKISRIITGPDSQPLDIGREQRDPPRAMRRAITARDQGCRYPGCDRRPSWCQAHHIVAWYPDGDTKVENLVLLCSYHHHVIHRPGWTATFDGLTFTVTNPTGALVGTT